MHIRIHMHIHDCLVLLVLVWPFIFCAIKHGQQIAASTNNFYFIFLSFSLLVAVDEVHILKLLKNLRCHSQGKEISDADILSWANNKVKKSGKTSQMESFKVLSSISHCLLVFFFLRNISCQLFKYYIFLKFSFFTFFVPPG